jgi:hypothetical protein
VDAGGAAVLALLVDALRGDGEVPLCARLLPKLARLLPPPPPSVDTTLRPARRQPAAAPHTGEADCALHAAVVAFASTAGAAGAAGDASLALSAAVELLLTLRVHTPAALVEPLFSRALHLGAVRAAEAVVRLVAAGWPGGADGEVPSFVGDATSSLGDVESSLGDG